MSTTFGKALCPIVCSIFLFSWVIGYAGVLSVFLPPILNSLQNSRSIQKVVTLLIPGLTSSLLALPPLPTSATANPNVPLPIPQLDASTTDIPYIASIFSHACPTRAPGEPTRMHSVLSAFFHGPVSGEERRKRMQQRLTCELL